MIRARRGATIGAWLETPRREAPRRSPRRALIEGPREALGGVALPELERALEEHVGELRARFVRLLMGWALAMDVLWWPTDFALVGRIPRALPALAVGRLTVLVCGGAVLALLHRQERVVGARFAPCCAAWVALYAGVGYGLGLIGDLGTPWFHMLQPLLVIALVVPMRLGVRCLLTGCIAAALLGGFLAHDPASLRSPHLPTTVGYLAFSAGVGVFFGHALLQHEVRAHRGVALTNVLRHAQAGKAEVWLRFLPDAVEVEVWDDGVGLPPPSGRGRGVGLLGMRERAFSLGGALSVEANDGGGTRVRCRLPLAGRAAAGASS